ncbi:MAG: DUF1566 domain-containing protein [Tannerellaceae bacterium]|jgi:hypothetical protein|nr:DUF1566 domain-containing protein [Tannerellaceae bacterium]
MIKKTAFLLCLLLIAISPKAQTGQISEGSIINGTNGKPAGVVYQYDPATATGYMVSLVETQLPWGDTGTNIDRLDDHINSALAGQELSGLVNTAAIVSQLGAKTPYAARWCFELNAGGLTGWYLPSCGELNILLSKKQIVNQALEKAKAPRIANAWHWSSSEGDDTLSWNVNMSGGDNYPADKSATRQVRAIRKFYK